MDTVDPGSQIQSSKVDIDHACDLLREHHRNREDIHRAEKAITLRIKAKCRRLCAATMPEASRKKVKDEADKLYKSMRNGAEHLLVREALVVCDSLFAARRILESRRKDFEKDMRKVARTLPVHPWAVATRGFGELGLAQIVGECGDLSLYSNPAKLWKRLGLAVIEGGRQRKVTGADALIHGYSPSRRSVMWSIGDSMVKASPSHYRDIYLARKELEVEKAKAEGLTVVPAEKIPKGKESDYRSQGHVHSRAKRYMEKRLVRDLWSAWKEASK